MSASDDDDMDEARTKALAETQKGKGNKALQNGEHKQALKHYSMAINLDPTNAVYFSNRSACQANLGNWSACLEDSNKTIELRPEWFKGYTRLAFAFTALKMIKNAEKQYQIAAAFDDAPQSVHDSLAKCSEQAASSNSTIEEEQKWLMDQQAEENKKKMAEAGCSVM